MTRDVSVNFGDKKVLLSGVKPTGRPHIGNYFGALKQFVELQDSYFCFFMIADYHALNFIQNREEMAQNIFDLLIDYLAIGLDPKRSVIFKQSDVPAHTELTWIFDTITAMPYLERAHAYKDAKANNREINVGTFNYPMLMAADILLYDTDIVPVGQDQKQHVEYARDTAEKFNRIFGSTFKLPEPLIRKEVATVPGIDGRKMSKSYNNDIGLFANDDEIIEKVMSIVTDSKGERPENVFKIHELFRAHEELEELYDKHKGQYKKLKEILIEDIVKFITPLRKRRQVLAANRESALDILRIGAAKANDISGNKMEEVKDKIGLKIS